jgi:serine/threonine-protein kinase
MRLETGQRVDTYEVERPLGVGGMNEAYLARDVTSGRQVVLKLPHPHLLGDQAAYSRFQREIEIGLRLNHPNIQHLLGTGHLNKGIAPYIVMEYVDGESFRDYLAGNAPLPIDRAIDFAAQLASALAYCHEHGVVHRDIKPENILISDGKTLKLMDFGIALLQGARRVTWGSLSAAVGTPDYMAPEQVRGERGDERTDVYAVGVILYEMLAGDVPFSGDNSLAIMSQHVTQDAPRVDQRRPEVSPQLAAVVARALAREPAVRYPSMNDFLHDLTHLDEVDAQAVMESMTGVTGLPRASVTWIVIAAVLAGLVVIGVLAEFAHRAQGLH